MNFTKKRKCEVLFLMIPSIQLIEKLIYLRILKYYFIKNFYYRQKYFETGLFMVIHKDTIILTSNENCTTCYRIRISAVFALVISIR